MAWLYEQLTGNLYAPDGLLAGTGYSGQPPHTNIPADQSLEGLGPIPCGLWHAVEMIPDTEKHGPYVIRLEPDPATDTLGRSGFLMHGDSIARPGYGSDGCIVEPRAVREAFWSDVDHDILVVAENTP